MLQEIGTGLTYIAGFVIVIYPVFIALMLDILILMAIAKAGGGSQHPFLTGMLFGFAFSNRNRSAYYSSSLDPSASYIALVILCPINAGLAILLAFYLAMPMLAWILGLIPAGALVLLGVGVLAQHFGVDVEETTKRVARAVILAPQSLFNYLKDRQPALGTGLLLVVTASVGTALLHYFGFTLAAYCLGFATIGALTILGLGYLAKYAFEFKNGTLPKAPDYDSIDFSKPSDLGPDFDPAPAADMQHPSAPPPAYEKIDQSPDVDGAPANGLAQAAN